MVINCGLIAGVFLFPPIALLGRFLVSGIWIVSYEYAEKFFTLKKVSLLVRLKKSVVLNVEINDRTATLKKLSWWIHRLMT